MNNAVLLDKDGTLVEDDGYSPGPWRLRPNAIRVLRELQDAGFLLVVVTNQSGIARGLMTEADLMRSKDDMERRLGAHGIRLAGFYHCPHAPDGGCRCRKPEPGMLIQAAEDLDLDLSRSWMVGDKDTDAEAGHRAGCRSIKASLPEAVRTICSETIPSPAR